MNHFNPNRLIIARKRRKYSSKELADIAGFSPITISRLEKSGNPEDETISKLAQVLNFPVSFFYGNDIDILTKDSASFRSLKSMKAKERESALTAGSIAFIVNDWMERNFNLPKLDLENFEANNDPINAAKVLRQQWGLGERPIVNVVKLLESKGIRVFSLVENTRNVDAFSCWRNDVPYVFLNTFKTPERTRFDAIHELGHLVMHKHGPSSGKEIEFEANTFASNFLMPVDDVSSRIRFVKSVSQLIDYKKRWGVSVAALAYRIHKLGIISDWQYRSFCIQISQFRNEEPEGLERETSVVWELVFRELWKEGVTFDLLAKTLNLPVQEIDNLLQGLMVSNHKFNKQFTLGQSNKGLRLVK